MKPMTLWSAAVVAGICLAGVAQAADFNIDELVQAAKQEPPITVYDTSGKVVGIAEGYAKKYGLQATGRKVDANAQLDMIAKEAAAANIQGDVLRLADGPAAAAQLIPQGYVESWLPPDMADDIAPGYRNPLAMATNANVWVYNTEVYDSCPVKSIWELTEPSWKGRVAFIDPLSKGIYTDWFNQMAAHGEDALKKAYEHHFGKPLETNEDSAAAAWIKAFASNSPSQAPNDEAVADAVGAPGQKEPMFGLISPSMFRHNADKGYKLGLCADLAPWAGWTYVKLQLIASGTKSPNAAKLFVHYAMTAEGMKSAIMDGNIPTNKAIELPGDEPSGLFRNLEKLLAYDQSTALEDFENRQDWQDFWRIHYKR